MKDKNIVLLEGVVGNDVKRGVANNGRNYITFTLCINTYMKELHDSTEGAKPFAYIRVFVFDEKQVKYLNRVKVHHGSRVSIFGRLNSTRSTIGSKDVIQINVVVRDINVTKTSEKDEEKDIEMARKAQEDQDTTNNNNQNL